ncbi:hypothetical protein V8C37DRAFT_370916 [Trichoderma ceciliae]
MKECNPHPCRCDCNYEYNEYLVVSVSFLLFFFSVTCCVALWPSCNLLSMPLHGTSYGGSLYSTYTLYIPTFMYGDITRYGVMLGTE